MKSTEVRQKQIDYRKSNYRNTSPKHDQQVIRSPLIQEQNSLDLWQPSFSYNMQETSKMLQPTYQS